MLATTPFLQRSARAVPRDAAPAHFRAHSAVRAAQQGTTSTAMPALLAPRPAPPAVLRQPAVLALRATTSQGAAVFPVLPIARSAPAQPYAPHAKLGTFSPPRPVSHAHQIVTPA